MCANCSLMDLMKVPQASTLTSQSGHLPHFSLPSFVFPSQRLSPESDRAAFGALKSLDWVGFVLFASSTIQLLFALEYGGNGYGWNSATVIGLICGSVGTMAAFALWERRKGKAALLPLALLRKRFLWCSALVMMLGVSNSFCASYYLPIYFQAIKNESPTMSGVSLLPNIISQITFAVLSGALGKQPQSATRGGWILTMTEHHLVRVSGYYLPWSVLAGILLSVGSGLISTCSPWTRTGAWVGFQVILGAGRGLGMQMVRQLPRHPYTSILAHNSFSQPIVAVQANLPHTQIAIAQSFILLRTHNGWCRLLDGCSGHLQQ